ncbi:MAG: hypothetical protein MI867_18800, partial [Pseudomonadales bacterium]|nr:hypothetical protein [Pseudomonadales bacterium]
AVETLSKFNTINDSRIIKIILHSTGRYSPGALKQRPTSLSNKILANNSGSCLEVYRIYKENLKENVDVWDHIYIGLYLCMAGEKRAVSNYQPHNLPRLIAMAFSGPDMLSDIILLIKLCANYSGLTLYAGVTEFISIFLKLDKSYQDLWSLSSVGLYSSFYGIEDINPDNDEPSKGSIDLETTTAKFWSKHLNVTNQYLLPWQIVLNCSSLLSQRKFHQALKLLPKTISSSVPLPCRLLMCQLKLHILGIEGERKQVISLLNETVPYSEDILEIARFEEHIKDYNYPEDFSIGDKNLNASIAIFVAWVKTDNGKLLSYLRHSVKKSMRNFSIRKPSELIDTELKDDPEKLSFFLAYICTPQIIDNIPSLEGTKDVLIERQNICQLLTKLMPTKKEDYLSEIENIIDELSMEEGKRVVDRTRIYVDMEAHTKWIYKELEEDYDRYKDL